MISGVTYGVANQMQQLTSAYYGVNSEYRSYNSLFQLTGLSGGGLLNVSYANSATQNNGKIVSQSDGVSGEVVTYAYDALNRLASAVTSDNPSVTQWGQSYNYDGFGNLTDQNVIKGSAPTMHVAYSAARSKRARRSGCCANAAGRTLMATARASLGSLPRYTSPMPPLPSSPTIS